MQVHERTAPTLRDQVNHEKVLRLWHAGGHCTLTIAGRVGITEEQVCAIIERADRRPA